MKQSPSHATTAELIRSLATLPKDRLLVLWQQNFGKPAGSIRAELMVPVPAFRIQEKAHGGLGAGVTARLCEVNSSVAPNSRIHSEARQRFKSGTRLVREWKGKIPEVIRTEDGSLRAKRTAVHLFALRDGELGPVVIVASGCEEP